MKTKTDAKSYTNNAKEVVITFINALNEEDFEKARNCLRDDMVFDGVLGHRNGAGAYVRDMEKMKFKYKIEKTFEDGNDVCLLYDINMSGKNIFTCGWYQIKDNKIKSLKVVFDPRPVFENLIKSNCCKRKAISDKIFFRIQPFFIN